MPPDLVELGDRLEKAAEQQIARKRTRRQLVLNAAASLIVAVPIAFTVTTTQVTTTTVGVQPIVRATPTATPTGGNQIVPDVLPSGLANRDLITVDDEPSPSDTYLPRDLRHLRLKPSSELLLAPSALRPALR